MRAVQFDAYGSPEVLTIREYPNPAVSANDVLVRVAATSINAADTFIRSGKIKFLSGKRFPIGTGFDFTGDIVEVGSAVKAFKAGDPVWGFINKGVKLGPTAAAAELVSVPASNVSLRPKGLDAINAAALPGAAGAALGVLRDTLEVKVGERVLIRGASGGVGTAAIQLAHAMGGRVVALVRKGQIAMALELGAEEAFDYRETDPKDLGKFDVILDPVAKDLRKFHRLLNPGGRMAAITIGGLGDATYMLWSVIYGPRRVRFVQSPPTGEMLASLTGYVDAKAIKPVVDTVYSLTDIASAHRAQEAGGRFGKQVVRLS